MRNTVLFDLDGTLLDTLADITAATNDILVRYGRPACTEEEMRGYIGNGAKHQFRSAWKAEVEDARLEEALAAYRPYYADYVGVTHPYDGIVELLQMLRERGFRTANHVHHIANARLARAIAGDDQALFLPVYDLPYHQQLDAFQRRRFHGTDD